MTDQPTAENPFGETGALAMEFHEDLIGKQWISCDSIYDMCQAIAGDRDPDSPVKMSFAKVADSFRPFTTYAQLEGTAPGRDAGYESVKPYPCPECDKIVVAAPMYRHTDTVVVADFLPHPDGTLVPMCSATDQNPQMHFLERETVEQAGETAPWLRVHKCGQE